MYIFLVEKLHLYVENWQSCLHSTWFYDELLSSDAAPSWWRVWCQHGKTLKLSVEKFTNKHFNLLFHTKTDKCLLFQLPLVRPHLFLSANLNWTCGHLARPHSALSSLCSQPPGLQCTTFVLPHPTSPVLCHGRARRSTADQRHSGEQQDLPIQAGAAGRICSGKVQLGAALCQRPVPRVPGEHHRRWAPLVPERWLCRTHPKVSCSTHLDALDFQKRWLLASGGCGGGMICCTFHLFGSWSLKVEQTPDWWYCHEPCNQRSLWHHKEMISIKNMFLLAAVCFS